MVNQLNPKQYYCSLPKPLLILSSRAGRGNISIAEAVYEYLTPDCQVFHRSIEDFMPRDIVHEDLVRYKFISNHIPHLLSAIYTIPLFYQRKLIREKLKKTRLDKYREFLETNRIQTVVCISHRQAFWTSVLKRNKSLDISVYGVLTEFGNNPGWRYIFWDQMNGFISPLPLSVLSMGIPEKLPFVQLPLQARSVYYSFSKTAGSRNHCLLIGGYFGQGRLLQMLQLLHSHYPDVMVYVICGDNHRLEKKIRRRYCSVNNINVSGLVDSIEQFITKCDCVITKPGMGTLLEAHAAKRKIFLFKGMPVAETNNARFAINNFGAEWFSLSAFMKWYTNSKD